MPAITIDAARLGELIAEALEQADARGFVTSDGRVGGQFRYAEPGPLAAAVVRFVLERYGPAVDEYGRARADPDDPEHLMAAARGGDDAALVRLASLFPSLAHTQFCPVAQGHDPDVAVCTCVRGRVGQFLAETLNPR